MSYEVPMNYSDINGVTINVTYDRVDANGIWRSF